jgi:hypothetical protein
MMRSLLLLMIALGLPAAHAAPLETLTCQVLAAPSPAHWGELRNELGREVKRGMGGVLGLAVDPATVLSIGAPLGEGDAGLVYSAETTQGRLAIKFYRGGREGFTLKSLATAIQIHRVLGQLGLAPRVKGIVLRARVPELLTRFAPGVEPPKEDSEFAFALLTEELPKGITLKPDDHDDGHWDWHLNLLESKGWNIEAMIGRATTIQDTLTMLSLVATDLQIHFTTDGRMFLLDFDMYRWVSDDGLVYDFLASGRRVIKHGSNGGAESLPDLKSGFKRLLRLPRR